MESKVEVIGGLLSLTVIQTTLTKRTHARLHLVKNSYIEFHANLAHCFVRY